VDGHDARVETAAFVRAELPPAPSRVLEVGCGEGELARELAGAGYEVTAIDPAAPEGAIFRRLKLEDVDEAERFDAVVASSALHHVADLDLALDKVVRLLAPGGTLVLDEFGWDLLDAATAEWFHGQRRALVAAGRLQAAPATLAETRREWDAEHVSLHGFAAMRAAVDARFHERHFSWTPYLHRLLRGATGAELERGLIEAGAIRPIGFRYAGTPRV
jgi:SAM-dependent methyltransferase